MFKMPKKYLIESDEGFSVQVIEGGQLLYRERDRTMNIESERLVGATLLAVYSRSITRWNPPHENELLDESERRSIMHNILNAFASQGFSIRMEPPPWSAPEVNDSSTADETAPRRIITIRSPK